MELGFVYQRFIRYFVRADHLDRTTRGLIHEARDEFFDRPHYPASRWVGTASLLAEDALVEVEAEIPDEGWIPDVLTNTVGCKFVEEFATQEWRISPSSHSRQYKSLTREHSYRTAI